MDGALIIDKPEGWTSHDVVARARRLLGERRVGHAGTLDPFATGVLVLGVGRATRLIQFLSGLDKEYTATFRFGHATDTQDRTGKPLGSTVTSNELTESSLAAVLREFSGPLLQKPPMYSAKKVRGERLYKVARAGREVERAAAPVEIRCLEVEPGAVFQDRPDGCRDIRIRVCCSAGTYVRTLANDIGESMGIGTHLAELRRTKVGPHGLAAAVTMEDLECEAQRGASAILLKPAEALPHLASLTLDEREAFKAAHGGKVEADGSPEGGIQAGDLVKLCDSRGGLLAVAEASLAEEVAEDGAPVRCGRLILRPRVVFAG